MNFDINYSLNLFPLLLKYLDITISLSILSALIAFGIALIIASLKIYNIKAISIVLDIYVSFFRGTPLIVQLFLIYFGFPQIFEVFKSMNAYTAALIGISLHFSAYMSEAIRGAISSVDNGQHESALSLGFSKYQSLVYIILPQAIRIAIPSLMNNYIDIIKSTSLAFTLGVAEIMAKAQLEASASFKFFESFFVVSIIYWAMVSFFTYLQKHLENYLNKAY